MEALPQTVEDSSPETAHSNIETTSYTIGSQNSINKNKFKDKIWENFAIFWLNKYKLLTMTQDILPVVGATAAVLPVMEVDVDPWVRETDMFILSLKKKETQILHRFICRDIYTRWTNTLMRQTPNYHSNSRFWRVYIQAFQLTH